MTKVGYGAQGVRNSNARLTEDQVREIFSRIANGDRQQSIADDFHVHVSLISMMKRGKRWRHLRPAR